LLVQSAACATLRDRKSGVVPLALLTPGRLWLMTHIGSVVLNVTDIGRAATFWRSALGYVLRESDNPGALVPQHGQGPALLLDETDRTHLDLHVASEQAQQAEVERLLSLGAKHVEWEYPDHANFVVLADTEDNLFCVVNTEGGR
jgi:catechol 2,3-dioxygenase-like lactoylglutathione lyase family enzyme